MKILSTFVIITSLFYFVGCTDSAKNSSDVQDGPTDQQISQPVQDQTQHMQSQPVQNQMEMNNNTGVVLNPPHGQPGHDCAVNVGDPLPSQSQNTGAQQQSSPVQINATSPNNVNSQGSGVAINPPHGEPGHDCAVAVGAPLNK